MFIQPSFTIDLVKPLTMDHVVMLEEQLTAVLLVIELELEQTLLVVVPAYTSLMDVDEHVDVDVDVGADVDADVDVVVEH